MDSTTEIEDAAGAQRRGFLKCMLWAGTGVLWTVSSGVPRSALLSGGAMAATPVSGEITFVLHPHMQGTVVVPGTGAGLR